MHSLKYTEHNNKVFSMSLKYGSKINGGSQLLIYLTPVDSDYLSLQKRFFFESIEP